MEKIDFHKLIKIAVENEICKFSDPRGVLLRSVDYNMDYLLELYFNTENISQEDLEFVKKEFVNWLNINYKTIYIRK